MLGVGVAVSKLFLAYASIVQDFGAADHLISCSAA